VTAPPRFTHAVVLGAAHPLARPVAIALAQAGVVVSIAALGTERDEVTLAHSIHNQLWSMSRDGQALTLEGSDGTGALAYLETVFASLDIAVGLGVASLEPLRAAAARMRARGGGRLIFVADPGDAAATLGVPAGDVVALRTVEAGSASAEEVAAAVLAALGLGA
jgi:hypothetical protein